MSINSCTGARQVATLFPELKRTNKRVGVTSMCMGTGMSPYTHDSIHDSCLFVLL